MAGDRSNLRCCYNKDKWIITFVRQGTVTVELVFDLGGGLPKVLCLWPLTDVFHLKIYCAKVNFEILLTVHLSIIMAIEQLNAQILIFLISLLYSSTCFEHWCAHHQEVKLYYTASGIVTLWRLPSGAPVERGLSQPAHRTATYSMCLYQMLYNTIWPPDDEHIVLETCRGI